MAVAVPRKGSAPRPAARADAASTMSAAPVTAEVTTSMNEVHQLTAETYHDFLATHHDKLVLVDFYAVWCGPCKMMAPELDKMAAVCDTSKQLYAKLDCGATNESKKLAMSLGIKALPTFHLYRGHKIVDQMTGAKIAALKDLINKHL
ncbi:hypothetical protein HYH03_018773 [Edaphochlamys debaryana]|uniref:Thioredoxin domain-containing protein n=1 Tax=Edaphochlamys debaryana TaxID=47281 RepID=A0A835XGD1_9CHLO|nr:hypothetical protein HYH03_018773 [Edaphochlamys debaryana]|eukprot:KAG2482288.1 hypothetical protein HYH03_018773 [Edaphochlamys debaryana]